MLVSLMSGEDASHFGLVELCAKAYTRQKQTILDRSKNIHSFLSVSYFLLLNCIGMKATVE